MRSKLKAAVRRTLYSLRLLSFARGVRGGFTRRLRDCRQRLARAKVASKHAARVGDRSDLALIFDSRRWLTSRVESWPRAAEVAAANRGVVLAAFEHADVPYFEIPSRSVNRFCVVVPEADRDKAWAAIADEAPVERYVIVDGKKPHTVPVAEHPSMPAVHRSADVLRVFEPISDPSGRLVFGQLAGCDIEFWRATDDEPEVLRSRRWNPVTQRASATSFRAPAFGNLHQFDECVFPVDIVITWVDGRDPAWIGRKNHHLAAIGGEAISDAADDSRFEQFEELRYGLRSIDTYADFVRNVYIVTDEQRPTWLVEDDCLRVVDHAEILPESARPTFNSHAIEASLHHIDGLAEQFIYMNDDFVFGRRVRPELFFTAGGLSQFFLSRALIGDGAGLSVDLAARSSQALVAETFGCRVGQKFKHAPYALRRSVMTEIEERFAEIFDNTIHARFRSADDLPIPSSFHHYFGFLTGRAVPGDLTARYIDLGSPDFENRADLLLHAQFDTLCLNDSGGPKPQERRAAIREFLDKLHPVASRWERSSDDSPDQT